MDGPSHLSHDTSTSGSARQHSSHPFYSGQEATPKQSSRQDDGGVKRLRKEEYTIAWICALPVPEWKASRFMFDKVHEDVFLGAAGRHQYVYGSMIGHNVVMGCLPIEQLGESSAAAVASEMFSTFPSLRLALLVGVGGGVWSEDNDVRLGDVVVSQPNRVKRHGGVIQYDYGKAVQGRDFELMGTLNLPQPLLLSALGKVQTTPPEDGKFDEYLQSFESYKDRLTSRPVFLKPSDADILFKPDCVHPSDERTCKRCNTEQSENRPKRVFQGSVVHYGLIASGNQIIKDAEKRDTICQKLGGNVLCFEMEAAGLVNQISSLVIRGICDYCDSHKNKAWQPYAAAAAAAWAKELLRNISLAECQDHAVWHTTLSQYSHPPLAKSWMVCFASQITRANNSGKHSLK